MTAMSKKKHQYRNHFDGVLEESSRYQDIYVTHISAMTTEDLHKKSEFGHELAFRDYQIEQSKPLIEKYRTALADAIRRPMGTVPESAEGLVNLADLDAAEQRRPNTKQFKSELDDLWPEVSDNEK